MNSERDSRYLYWQELEFTSDKPSDTSVVDDTDSIVFSARTTPAGAAGSIIRYTGENGTPVATLEARRVLGARLCFADGGKKVAPGKWLKHSKNWEPGQLDVMHYTSFESINGNKYTWKGYAKAGPLSLYLDGVGLVAKSEAARKPKRENDLRARPMVLLLSDVAQADRDAVILSFLLTERERQRRGGSMMAGDGFYADSNLLGVGMVSL